MLNRDTQAYAPIVLFVYNRPDHTRQTIQALQSNTLASFSDLYIYSDAAKNENAAEAVSQVREIINTLDGFNTVTIIEREENWGLAKSIIDGVTHIVNSYGRIIVLEDDLLCSPNFLNYMNDILEKYKGNTNVYSASGYSFSNDYEGIDNTYFLAFTSSWSWCTWKEKWAIFNNNPDILQQCLNTKDKEYVFDYDNSYKFSNIAQHQLENKIDSWAIYWYASVFLKGGLTLYPAKSLVSNIGFDGSGTHCIESNTSETLSPFNYILTDDIFEKQTIKKIIKRQLRKTSNPSITERVINKIKRFLN